MKTLLKRQTIRLGLHRLLLLLIVASLGACGFELRGSNLQTLKNSSVYVASNGANALAAEIRRQLQFAEVPLAGKTGEADYIINVSNEAFERKVLSISAQTGKVEEYEITYRATLAVTDQAGKTLIDAEKITAQRDYVFDEGAVLGKFEEENVLRKDISEHAAASVLRRLQAVTQ